VLLDVDGVILDFLEWYRTQASIAVGRPVRAVDPSKWDLGEYFGLSRHEVEKVNQRVYTEVPNNLPLVTPDVVSHIKDLRSMADVVFPTTSYVNNPSWEFGRRQQFRALFGKEAVKDLIFVDRKEVVVGDILVDDKPSNVFNWINNNERENSVGVLFGHYSYNSGLTLPASVIQTNRWEVVKELTKQMILDRNL
jgi:5'(3')-deoxyribonucleotidase